MRSPIKRGGQSTVHLQRHVLRRVLRRVERRGSGSRALGRCLDRQVGAGCVMSGSVEGTEQTDEGGWRHGRAAVEETRTNSSPQPSAALSASARRAVPPRLSAPTRICAHPCVSERRLRASEQHESGRVGGWEAMVESGVTTATGLCRR